MSSARVMVDTCMRKLGITEAFTVDEHFSMMGFVRHP